ncbi:MAG: hypothetical protein R2849_11910 [Thermomicrobiales bacterium]
MTGFPGKIANQRCLPDPCVATEHDNASSARTRCLQRFAQPAPLFVPAYEQASGHQPPFHPEAMSIL